MDILDFLDILLKPPQPLMGLFFTHTFAVSITSQQQPSPHPSKIQYDEYDDTKPWQLEANDITGRARLIRTRLIRSST